MTCNNMLNVISCILSDIAKAINQYNILTILTHVHVDLFIMKHMFT